MRRLPVRGPAVRDLGLPLPPAGVAPGADGAPPMPRQRSRRPLKRWRWVGAFGPDLMLCAGDARIGPVPQRWWAVVERGGRLRERTGVGSGGLAMGADRVCVRGPDLRLDLELDSDAGGEPVEVASPTARGDWIWTRKVAAVPVRGTVELAGRRRTVELEAMIDDSAGYHDRRTAWRWTTGVGRAVSGECVAWNLVAGVHDAPSASERTVWVDGDAREVGRASFAEDLSRVEVEGAAALEFTEWAVREHRANLLAMRSAYRQPFGTFAGELPGGLRLAEGYGVMEEHDVRW